jgi:enoyl-[acyl-carrier protein] reductase II
MLTLKAISPTRLIKNDLYNRIVLAEREGASVDELRAILGKAAAKRGIFEGDLDSGELEIGQIASAVKEVLPVADVMDTLIQEFDAAKMRITNI